MALFYRICGYGCYLLALGVVLMGFGSAYDISHSYNASLIYLLAHCVGFALVLAVVPYLLGRACMKWARREIGGKQSVGGVNFPSHK